MPQSLKETALCILFVVGILYFIGGFVVMFFGLKTWLLYAFVGVVARSIISFVESSYHIGESTFYNSLGRIKRLRFFLIAIGIEIFFTIAQTLGNLIQEGKMVKEHPYLCCYIAVCLLSVLIFVKWISLCNYAKRFHDIGIEATPWIIITLLSSISCNITIHDYTAWGILLGLPGFCITVYLCLKNSVTEND